ncbi:MAG: S9 family peptidase [Bacteroidales bacterium]|nr:S9 family peptidase [Bacteroidales bacterium]MBN2820515.1 S9 family peptidase [Bacteroidales bacterium]
MKFYKVTFFLLLSVSTSLFAEKEISLEDIFLYYKFSPQTVSIPRSMNDGKTFTSLKNGREIVKYSFETGNELEILFSLKECPIDGIVKIDDYSFSDNEMKLLLTTEIQHIYRHSYIAEYYIYDIGKKTIDKVFDAKIQLARISPDGSQVAFVFRNNIYLKNLENNQVKQITFDGEHAAIINGMPDWVYEEEFTLIDGLEWSPDSKKLAYYRFDETRVREYQLVFENIPYPEWYKYKYPKSGEENSTVSIYVFNTENNETVKMETGENTDVYFPRIKWTADPGQLCIIRLNRRQNKAELLSVNAFTGACNIIYTEVDERYISEFTDDFATFLSDNQHVLILSEKDGFQHIYLYDLEGKLVSQLTSGNWEVDEFYGIDEKTNTVYYSSTEVSPLERHIYSININNKKKQKLSNEKGINSALFSTSFDYYLNSYTSATTPLTISVNDKNGKQLRILEDNSRIKQYAINYNFTDKEIFSFQGPDANTLYGFMYKPSDFNENKKYPLLIYVYGGPESQEVRDEWERRRPWFQYLNQHGYVVACIDNRGTDGRGAEFKKSTYLTLGKLETEDQVAAARYLGSLSYIDADRIGIFGWSYGGTMSLNCLLDAPLLFKVGIAVAPVTNWRFYDTAYTERFMRKPDENEEGYDENSPLFKAQNLQGKLLLIHGIADDNVHIQNSTELVKRLVDYNKQFDMFFYPDKNHGLYGGYTQLNVFAKISDYIIDNL